MSSARILAVLSLLLVVGSTALTQEIREAEFGIGGHAKHGKWVELRTVVAAGDAPFEGQLEVVARDGDGATVAYVHLEPVSLAAGGAATLRPRFKLGPPRTAVEVRLMREGRVIATKQATSNGASASTSELLVTLGPAITSGLADLLRRYNGEEVDIVPLDDTSSLPQHPLGYDAVDTLLVTISDTNPLDALTPEQTRAMSEWVEQGGHLVLVAGDAAEPVLSNGKWASHLKLQSRGRAELSTDGGLRSYTGDSLDIATRPSLWQVSTVTPLIELTESGTSGGGNPLIVRAPAGFGRVTAILLDLSQPPFEQWKGRPRLLARAITGETLAADPQNENRSGGRMTHLGYRDLSGQLRTALDQYAGVSPIHFYPVAGALLLYMLALGPGQYFLLRNAGANVHLLAWTVFPALVLFAVVGASALAFSTHGSQRQVNHLELVDLHLEQGLERGRTWTSVFSPQGEALSLQESPRDAMPGDKPGSVRLAWQALPGTGLGGVDTPPLGMQSNVPYRLVSTANEASLERLQIPRASSKVLTGGWEGQFEAESNPGSLRRGRLRTLEGTFRVVAPQPLENAYLAFGDSMFRARSTLRRGDEIAVDQLEHKHLEYQLTRRQIIKDSELTSPWNQEELDVPRILEIMCFHGAVRGRRYTVLSHQHQEELDLSFMLKRGYAVLIGRAANPAVDVTLDGRAVDEAEMRRWTFYRIVYPVAEPAGL